MSRTIRSEFPDFPIDSIPAQVLDQWESTAWHNEACPSFVHGRWHLFVDYPDVREREWPEKRFTLSRFRSDDLQMSECAWVCSSETWEPIAAILAAVEAAEATVIPEPEDDPDDDCLYCTPRRRCDDCERSFGPRRY